METNPQGGRAEEEVQVEVINDIAVILRIEGKSFEAAEIWEPMSPAADLSIYTQRMTTQMQEYGADLIGKLIATVMLEAVDSELGRRLQRDKWLTRIMASTHMRLCHADPQDCRIHMADAMKRRLKRIRQQEVGLVPEEQRDPKDMRAKIMDRLNKPIGGS